MPHELLLIADGSPLTHAEVAEVFAGAGVEVIACADGSDLLDLARDRQPQVVLLDAALPGVDACAVVGELERSVETRAAAVVLTCPREMHEARVAELEASGALLVLVKPLTRDGLLQMLAQALAESRRRKSASRPRRRRAA